MLPKQELILSGLIFSAASYLMGSLSFSIWIGKGFFDTDVRDHGSGNAGATNTWRVLGWKAGLPVLVLDIGKGLAATFLPYLHASLSSEPDLILWSRILCGLSAGLGHIFPVFAQFRGGKAVATLFGVVMGLMPLPAVISLAVFVFVFLVFHLVSLGSIAAGISLPFLVYFFTGHPVQLMLVSVLVASLVLVTHRRNIGRLIRREETRLYLKRKNP